MAMEWDEMHMTRLVGETLGHKGGVLLCLSACMYIMCRFYAISFFQLRGTSRVGPIDCDLPPLPMIAVQAASYMQSLINSATLASALDTTTDLFKRSAVQDSLAYVDQHAVAHDFKADLAHMLSSDDGSESKSNTGKPARKLTRRQLKHREAMVRFRQRKKAKIAVLEEEELRLQAELDEKLREYKRRAARQPPVVDGLVGVTNREKMLHRSFVETVVQIEGILDENEALEEAIAVHDKFHGTLKRVRERIVETSVWKCV